MSRVVKQPSERRKELLDIGLRLFLEKGSAGVSIQSVIKQANVATGLFYYYFESKEAFLEEVIKSYVISLSNHFVLTLAQDEDNALLCIKKALPKFSARFSEIFPMIHDEAIDTPAFHIVIHGLLQRVRPAMEQLIDRGVSQGVFHVDSPALTASFIVNGLVGILHGDKAIVNTNNFENEVEHIVFALLGVDDA